MKYIRWFSQIGLNDVGLVGGKNASLGHLIAMLSVHNIRVPPGFAVTADGYWLHLDHNGLREPITQKLLTLKNPKDLTVLKKVGSEIRTLIARAPMPDVLRSEIEKSYENLCTEYGRDSDCDVAVRSSATAEDLPTASFAGQQETFLNIRGIASLIHACTQGFASLFTDRAIAYRITHNFDHMRVALSLGIQKMVRSDLASAGTAFSLDTESGFKDVVLINAAYGLGETVVQGTVVPDEFVIHKPTLLLGKSGIIQARLGSKKMKAVYTNSTASRQRKKKKPIALVKVDPKKQAQFSISDNEVRELAQMVIAIENEYSSFHKRWTPVDVEWAKDGANGHIYIVQARPETVHAQKKKFIQNIFTIATHEKDLAGLILARGQSIGQQVCHGTAHIISDIRDLSRAVKPDDIFVTTMTNPDWGPALKQAAGVIAEQGGRTSHVAIVSRELGIPAIIGATGARKNIKQGASITIDCSQGNEGFVYKGHVPFTKETIALDSLPQSPVSLMMNISNPDEAFRASQLPVGGVGLVRLEFILGTTIGIHPLACIYPEKLSSKERRMLSKKVAPLKDPQDFFVDQLSQGVATIAAAFYPRPVIVRFSDFKTDEYRSLLGGALFEPQEQNPMLGLRGASRYLDEHCEEAFDLEIRALKHVYYAMGFTNIIFMVPFVRTIQEAQNVIKKLIKSDLIQVDRDGKRKPELYLMIEVPSDVLLFDDFAKLFDGFSIGSNDLTQLILGVDRNSEILAKNFNESDKAVTKAIERVIKAANKIQKPIGLCGQIVSQDFDYAQFLIDSGISSISLDANAVIPFLRNIGNF